MKKYIFGAVLSIGILVSPAFTQAAGLTDVQIQAILSLLSSFGADSTTIANVQTSLTGGTPTVEKKAFCHNFNNDMTVGSNGDDVSALNQVLSYSGIDTTGNSSNFSENNAGDVVSFQAKYGIRQTGYVGPMTRKKLNSLYGCSNYQQKIYSETTSATTQPTTPTVSSISEQVKCVFNGATTEQKCLGDAPSATVGDPVHYSCSGITSCVVDVKGAKGRPITWGSSCGGGVYTTIDGNNEYANFSCANASTTPVAAPVLELWVSPSFLKPGQSATVSWSSGNTNKCTAYENNTAAAKNPEAVKTIGSSTEIFNVSKTYTFTCIGPGGSITKSITITVNNVTTDALSSIKVLYPNGGEKFARGKTYTLTWSAYIPSGTVDLYVISSDGTVQGNIAKNIANTGSYEWTIPASQLEGAHRFYVSSDTISDHSDNIFEIWDSSHSVWN